MRTYEIYVDGEKESGELYAVYQVADFLYVENLFSRRMADKLECRMQDRTDTLSLMYTVLDWVVTGVKQPIYDYSKEYYSDMLDVVEEMLDEDGADKGAFFEAWNGKKVEVVIKEDEQE